MQGQATFLGHPLHQMLVVFPLGLLGASVAFDWLALGMDSAQFSLVAFYLIAGGLISGLLAAPFGLIDWMSIPKGSRAQRIGLIHAGGNVIVLLLFAASWVLREPAPVSPPWQAYALAWGGALGSLVTAWLGGELVDRLGVGVSEGANVDAPSSLSTRQVPARARTQTAQRP